MAEQKEIIISEFPIHKIRTSCSFVIIGAPSTGKTTFINDLVRKNKHKYPVIRVACGTESTQHNYSKNGIPSIFISNEYDIKDHTKFVQRQKLCKDECSNPNAIYIVDDCNTDRKIFNTPLMKAQFKNGSQWWDCLFILGSHYVFDMPPDIRKCVNYVALFQETSIEERKKLYQNFSIGCSFPEFCDLMDQITGDHTCLIFDKTKQSNNIEDSVFYYKASLPTEKPVIGCEEYHKWHKDRYNINYVEPLDPNVF